jgi:hypothetical protein
MLLIVAFALAVLAGRGLDLFVVGPKARRRRIVRGAWLGMLVTAVLIGAGVLLILHAITPVVPLPAHTGRRVLAAGLRVAVLLALAGLTLGLGAGSSVRRVVWVVPVLLVVDLFSFGRDYNPSIPRPFEYPASAPLDFLRTRPGPFRVLGLDGQFPPNANAMYGIEEVRGYNALDRDTYLRFLAATGPYPQPASWFPTLHFSNFESRLVDLLNVRYVLSSRELRHPKLSPVWERGTRVYENRAALPRAFMVYASRVLSDGRAVERALRDPHFDPGTVVLLEAPAPVLAGPADPAPTVRILQYHPEWVEIGVETRYPGVLVLGDAWFPGWRAQLDGARVSILRADLILRAVEMPPGSHRVRFEYRPLSFRLGLIASGLGVSVLAALGAGSLRWRWCRRSTVAIPVARDCEAGRR